MTRHPPAAPRPTTASAVLDLAHREEVDWHYHEGEQQLAYPSTGVLQVSTAAGSWVVPPLRAVWLPAGVPHAHRAHGPTRLRTLTFPTAANPLGLAEPAVLTVSPLLREVIVALTDDEPLDPEQQEDLRRVALGQLRVVPVEAFHLPMPTDPRLRDLTSVLADDPGDDRTLSELGAVVGASERTLSRLFRSQTGMTFPQWRAQLRLHRALVLLSTGRSVTVVAVDCGYRNPSAFILAFRQAFGVTPGAYRRTMAP